MSFATGEPERNIPQIRDESDIFELRHFISPQPAALLPAPLVLVVSEVVADIAYRAAWPGNTKGRERNPNLEMMLRAYHYQARTGRTWTRILEVDSRGYTEEEHLQVACRACGIQIEQEDTPIALARKWILHVAAQEPIVIASE